MSRGLAGAEWQESLKKLIYREKQMAINESLIGGSVSRKWSEWESIPFQMSTKLVLPR
ncbi:hypothetical protein [Rickettsiales endosymbiont of Peranema trichophorum]|uniref:hypothetical protein n=1 Tax=Rickettsiales endosymbiont of Peranema trichophorum TaxID=2486577 RepID=UPI0013EE40D9|nr:hypothetical protein [Rickettsiales endosymbiont of Peranema trichophorum]